MDSSPASTQLSQYLNDGYLIASDLIPVDDVLAVRNSLIKTFQDQTGEVTNGFSNQLLYSLMQKLFDHDIYQYKKVVGALWRKLDVNQLMHHPKVIQFLRKEFGWNDFFIPGGQVVLIMSHQLKIPGGYFGLAPHQDFPSVQGSLDGVVVWIPLVEVDEHNFPLEVIPGSHKNGILPCTQDASSSWVIRDDQYAESDFVQVKAKPGDVVFMSLFTLHRSSLIGDDNSYRLALSSRIDNAGEPTFIERGYPSAYLRSVHRDPMQAGFPTIDQIQNVFKL